MATIFYEVLDCRTAIQSAEEHKDTDARARLIVMRYRVRGEGSEERNGARPKTVG